MTLLRALVAVGLTGGILWALGISAVVAELRGVSLGWTAMAMLLLVLQIVLSAMRWRLTAGALGLTITRGLATREYFLAVLANSVLPGGVLGDVGRVARARLDAGLTVAAQSVVIERLAGQVALGLVALGAGLAVFPWLVLGALAAALAVVGLFWRAPALREPVRRSWLEGRIWRQQVAWSLGILVCNLGGFFAAAMAVGASMAPTDALLVLPLTLMAMLVPVSVAGWGLREGAAVVLWPLAGIAPEKALAASVLYGLICLAAALPGTAFIRRSAQGSEQANTTTFLRKAPVGKV